MSEINIVNLNNFTWFLNVAIMGAAFSVFSLIFNDYYIYYGMVTFAYGICTHVAFKLLEWKMDEKNKHYWLAHATNTTLTIIWLVVLIVIY